MKRWLFGMGILWWAATPAWALDTVESYGKGVGDLEFYAGYEGVRRAASDRKIGVSSVLGYGVLETLNLYAGLGLGADGRLANGEGAVNLGLFGTPLDTAHADMDWGLDAGIGGAALGDFVLTPSLELNVDTHPDRSGFSAFLTAATALSARTYETIQAEAVRRHHELAARTALGLGVSYGFRERHEVLAAWTSYLNANQPRSDDPAKTEPRWVPGKTAIGYNVKISDELEWIAELSYEWPKREARGAFGGLAGLVVTLPPAPTRRE